MLKKIRSDREEVPQTETKDAQLHAWSVAEQSAARAESLSALNYRAAPV